MHECPTCDAVLTTKRGMRQHHTKVHEESLPNRTCKGCETEFYDPRADRSFCDDCNPNAGEHNGNWKDAKEEASCRVCGEEFEYYPTDKDGVYCSECVERADGLLPRDPTRPEPGVETNCEYCGKVMRVVRCRLEGAKQGVFCDRSCHGKWLSQNIVGDRHHQWEGGNIRYGARWWRMRRLARERDGHACQICSASVDQLGRQPDVHHITPVREFGAPSEAHHLDNLISLCRSCHRRVESGSLVVPNSGSDT